MDRIKTVVIFCEKMAIGGTETMIMRLLSWYSANDYRVILLNQTEVDSAALSTDLNKIDFEHYIYNKNTNNFVTKEGLVLCFNKDEKVWVNTQFFPEFLTCYNLLRKDKYNCSFIHNIFIVHPYSTYLFGDFFNSISKLLVKILFLNRNLLFMDEACVTACKDFYNLNAESYNFEIYRLPFLIGADESVNETKSSNFNILTISRFEFPFKGYVLGLINSFVNICNDHDEDIKLTIIGYGKDKFKVDELISSLPLEISNKITILDEVPYSQVNEYINGCNLFVGMGTTVLDAANLNKIVIVPVAYQNSNLSTGFFHDKYNVVGEIFREGGDYETFEVLITKVLNYSQDDFIKISKSSKEVLRKHYDIGLIAKGLIEHKTKEHSWFDRVLVRAICKFYLFSVFFHKKKMLFNK